MPIKNNYYYKLIDCELNIIKLTEAEQKSLNDKLFEAIDANDLISVKQAVSLGANVNAKDRHGNPALHQSAYCKDTEITKYIIEQCTDINLQDKDGITLLHNVSGLRALDKVKLLLNHNADMYIKDKWGNTPFGVAIYQFEEYDAAEPFVLNGYIPTHEEFEKIEDRTKRESVRARLMTLTAQVQKRKARLAEEAETTEFSYADEIIEI